MSYIRENRAVTKSYQKKPKYCKETLLVSSKIHTAASIAWLRYRRKITNIVSYITVKIQRKTETEMGNV